MTAASRQDYLLQFDPGAIKHLGLQMYSTLPPVIAELVANAWDAGATQVDITIPTIALKDDSEIVVSDDGDGMTDKDIRERYLVVGRDRRAAEHTDVRTSDPKRKLMGRKGIGKFAGFGIAREVEVESVRSGETSRLVMDYGVIEAAAERGQREMKFPPLDPTGEVTTGTRVVLRNITKFRKRSISIEQIRRGLARRFSVVDKDFIVRVNGAELTPEERDLQRLLDVSEDGRKYLWEYAETEIRPDTGWKVSGWIGALNRTDKTIDGLTRGIVIMARGKLVQEPFVFNATVGQQYALSYLVGELHAEFVDDDEDSIGTARSTLVWDTEANEALLEWGEKQVQAISREWAARRAKDNEDRLASNPLYKRFLEETERVDNKRAKKIADKLIRGAVARNPLAEDDETTEIVQLCIDFVEFDAFWELAEQLADADVTDTARLALLFREWEIVEAKEMARVTNGRIATIEKLSELIEKNALEVPILHNFLKEFPWVIDPRWLLVADEQHYSKLLKERFPESDTVPEEDRRIDFLCVSEGHSLVVVEIKRPHSRVSRKELTQIEDYVIFLRTEAKKSTDPAMRKNEVVGYLLCGTIVDNDEVREKMDNLANAGIYVRRYGELLDMVRRSHREFLERYESLKRTREAGASLPQPDSAAG